MESRFLALLLLMHPSIINNKTDEFSFSKKLDRTIIQRIQNRASKTPALQNNRRSGAE